MDYYNQFEVYFVNEVKIKNVQEVVMRLYISILAVCVLSICGLSCRSKERQIIQPKSCVIKDPVGELLAAAKRNDKERLQELLDTGVDINQVGEGWGTALQQAAACADINTAKLLLEYGASVTKGDENGITPLHDAIRGTECVLKMVRLLVSHGANVNAKDRRGDTPLHDAVSLGLVDENLEYNDKAVIEYLLTNGANINEVNADGCTPLYEAYAVARLDIVKLLIEHGADVNIKNNEDGFSLLHRAAWLGDLEAVALFVKHGADTHARDLEGETPLQKAELRGFQNVIEYLMQQDSNLQENFKGQSTGKESIEN
jgi:ankyrin repeat protein